jgi:hypothetical protein
MASHDPSMRPHGPTRPTAPIRPGRVIPSRHGESHTFHRSRLDTYRLSYCNTRHAHPMRIGACASARPFASTRVHGKMRE